MLRYFTKPFDTGIVHLDVGIESFCDNLVDDRCVEFLKQFDLLLLFFDEGVDLADFARILRDLVDADDCRTLIVAGAYLRHVGAAFGDNRELDEGFLDEVRRRDARTLEMLAANDPEGLVRCLAEEENVTRVCSAGCIFAAATALSGMEAAVLRYHQAVDQPTRTCVTCSAVALT